jgi:DNA recombination protein RmuC
MQMHFENTAYKVLKEGSSALTEQNKERLGEFSEQFKELIESFEKRNNDNFKTEAEKLERFDEKMIMFLETGNKMSKEANSLTQAMKSDNRASGNWGEIVLERVLEASGLRKGEEFVLQQSTTVGKPDATVFLPEEKRIFIDSKTSLASWLGYLNAETDAEKDIHLDQFKASTKAHIKGLADRKYSDDERSPDYTLMFIPIESCYSLMFCEDNKLWEHAWKNGIMPVSPSTLLAALKIINSFHMVDRQNKNIKEVFRLCKIMADKFSNLSNDLSKIRTSFDNVFTKLDGQGGISSCIKKLEALDEEPSGEVAVL